jgi:hypothetical protein
MTAFLGNGGVPTLIITKGNTVLVVGGHVDEEVERLEAEVDENGEQKWHVLDDSDLMAGGEVDYGK